MKKILFLHGFFATGNCPMANAMREAFEGSAVVLTPDLPLHPKEALKEIGYVQKRCSSVRLQDTARLSKDSQR